MTKKNLDFRDEVFLGIDYLMKKDKKIFLLTNDMGAAGLDNLYKKYKERVINVGICEQNIMSVAGGLAQSGCAVFVYGIISHLIFRSLEQIKIDICLQNLPVHIIGVGAGLSYGQDGPTHHGVEDIGIAKVLPNLTIYNPSDPYLARKYINIMYKKKTPSFLRLDKEQIGKLLPNKSFDYFRVFGTNKRHIVFSSGYSTIKAMEYQKSFKKFSIFDICIIKDFNDIKIKNLLKSVNKIIILEENILSSLACDSLFKLKSDQNFSFKIKICALKKSFLFGSSTRDYIWKNKINFKKYLKFF